MATNTVWEWRTFGGGCEEAERRIRAFPVETGPRRATHLVCDMSAADVRVSDGTLVVRLLRQVAGHLEQWGQAVEARFPVDALTVRRVFGYLDLRPPTTEREAYSLHQFLDEIVAPQHALTAVQVGGIHHVATINGCTAEFAGITINEMPWKTLGISGADQAAVNATLDDLGLAGRPNINIVGALKQHLAHAS